MRTFTCTLTRQIKIDYKQELLCNMSTIKTETTESHTMALCRRRKAYLILVLYYHGNIVLQYFNFEILPITGINSFSDQDY